MGKKSNGVSWKEAILMIAFMLFILGLSWIIAYYGLAIRRLQ